MYLRSGRSPDWLKMKNPECAAVKPMASAKAGNTVGDKVQIKKSATAARAMAVWKSQLADAIWENSPKGATTRPGFAMSSRMKNSRVKPERSKTIQILKPHESRTAVCRMVLSRYAAPLS